MGDLRDRDGRSGRSRCPIFVITFGDLRDHVRAIFAIAMERYAHTFDDRVLLVSYNRGTGDLTSPLLREVTQHYTAPACAGMFVLEPSGQLQRYGGTRYSIDCNGVLGVVGAVYEVEEADLQGASRFNIAEGGPCREGDATVTWALDPQPLLVDPGLCSRPGPLRIRVD